MISTPRSRNAALPEAQQPRIDQRRKVSPRVTPLSPENSPELKEQF
jgi:hypothetical protein